MGSSDFTVLANPATPLALPPGEDIEFTVAYSPTVTGVLEIATIRISSNDPTAPFVDLAAVGMKGTAKLGTSTANSGFIGNACIGSFADTELTINSSGTCALTVSGISSSSAEFLAPQISTPLLVGSGESTLVTVRFQPAGFGAKAATITLFSNDPAGPRTVVVSGFAPAPRLSLVIANTANFGDCCVGSFRDEMLILNNSGRCTLTVTGIASSSGEFLVPEVLSYPLTIEAGGELEIPIRFQPASFGAKASTRVAFEHENRHWKLVHNPFPATLHPGSCLNVTIRYHATQKEPRPCELVIKSDDPVTPVKEVEVIAWTRCCCKKCCELCRAGCCCHEPHRECCEDHRGECCEHHDEERREGRDGPECRDKHGEEHHHKEDHHGRGNEGDGDQERKPGRRRISVRRAIETAAKDIPRLDQLRDR